MLAYIENVGCISPLGATWEENWDALLRATPPDVCPASLSTELHTDIPTLRTSFIDDLYISEDIMAARASMLALNCVNTLTSTIPYDTPIFIHGGSTHGEAELMIEYNRILHDRSRFGYSADVLRKNLIHETVPAFLARHIKDNAHVSSWICSSCVSSLHSLMAAILMLDSMPQAAHIVLGVDGINDMEIAGFNKIGGTTKTQCAPFSNKRDGILISEGAAGMIITKENQRALAGIAGMGFSCDADHPTSPNKKGTYLERCINDALTRASLTTEDITAIIAHGTGTPANDETEAMVIDRLFKTNVPVTSVKGSLGHTMGAAGLFNVLTGTYALTTGLLPPTSSTCYQNISSLDVVRAAPRQIDKNGAILIIASGFGGNNATAILKRT